MNFIILATFKKLSTNAQNLDMSEDFAVQTERICRQKISVKNIVEEREKMLVTSIFSFPHNDLQISTFPTFQKVIFRKGVESRKVLTHYQMTNFRLFQTERVRRQ